ncbi:MAG: hypothetical protein HOJ79_16840 [Nitrospina sp.]|nr:hypothetical protein [Nitrospina sp.]
MRLVGVFVITFVLMTLQSAPFAECGESEEQNETSMLDFLNSDEANNADLSDETEAPESSLGSDKSGSAIFPAVWCAKITDPETEKNCWESYREGLFYYKRGLEHRTEVFKWQHFSTQVIFYVVLFLVGVGVYFAWVQFQAGENSQANNEIEVSLTGVKVSSPVLGVIILVLSLAFFYLYLVYVYPIKEII